MAAKLLHSLADENPDLQKQIGCMTGILQIFDSQHIGRRLNGHTHKRLLPPGNSQFSNASHEADSSTAYNQDTMERIGNKYANDKRVSTESSRASFSSSSRSSSFSSLDCGRIGHPDPSPLDRIIFPETPSRDPVITQPSASPRTGRLSLDLRDVVKDSMHRESRGVVSKPRDSPSPLQLSKLAGGSLGSTMNGKNDLPADLKESLKVLAKLQEAPWYCNEKQHARFSYETKDGSSLSISRDAPRYSYDEREKNRLSFEPREFSKSDQRFVDLPRLSLDSKESSMRASSYESNLAYLSTSTQNVDESSNAKVLNTKQSSRPPSVVAKLMGLETLPDNKQSRDCKFGSIRTISGEDYGLHSMPSNISDICRPIRHPVSPRSLKKEPTSPRWKNTEIKPISSSKCPIEPAPWKHLEGSRSPQQQVARRLKSPESASKSFSSVYSEIEKRLKDLEFKQSGKDLRALKQILEAKQAKGLLGTPKEEQNLNMGSRRQEEQAYNPIMNSGFINANESHKNHAGTCTLSGTSSSSKAYESPIVIIKPAKLVKKSGLPASSLIPIDGMPDLRSHGSDIARQGKLSVNRRPATDQSSNGARSSTDRKANRNSQEAQNSTRPQRVSKDNSLSSSTNSGSTSPRLQKKLEFDKRSRPPTPPDSGKSRRQPNRQLIECGGSPGGRRRPKPIIVQQNADHLSERSSESRNFSGLGDDISVQSDSIVTLEHKRDVEVTSNEKSVEITECKVLPCEALKYPDANEIKTSSSTRSSDDDLVEELPALSLEHPSPISVLDNSAYREDSPPPVKRTSHDLEGALNVTGIGFKTREADHEVGPWNASDELPANSDDGSGLSTEINRNKLQSINNLVQKLRQLNSNHDEARTDYIASLCEKSSPDHRYVSEILLASGILLRDLGSGITTFQLHPSGHLINPELFLVLEQTKSSTLDNKITRLKFHRKLIFDVVNEILTGKFASLTQAAEPWLKPRRTARKSLNAQKLLRDLCTEIDQLQGCTRQELTLDDKDDNLKNILWEDIMQRSDSWTDFNGDFQGIVLDVERSIFKDLVDEVVIGEASGMRGKPGRRRRQLFNK